MHSVPQKLFHLIHFHRLLYPLHWKLQILVECKASSDHFFLLFIFLCLLGDLPQPCGAPHISIYLWDYFDVVSIIIRLFRSVVGVARIVANPILVTDSIRHLPITCDHPPSFCFVYVRSVLFQRRLSSILLRTDCNIIIAFAVPELARRMPIPFHLTVNPVFIRVLFLFLDANIMHCIPHTNPSMFLLSQ